MTADIFYFKEEFLKKLSGRIIGEVKGVNRVLYITSNDGMTADIFYFKEKFLKKLSGRSNDITAIKPGEVVIEVTW